LLYPDLKWSSGFLIPKLALILAAACYSAFGLFAKLNLHKHHPVALAAISATFSGLYNGTMVFFMQPSINLPTSSSSIIAIVWIGLITSALSQILLYYLIQKWSPIKLSMMSYVVPLTAVVLGVVALDEVLESHMILGGSLIFGCIYLIHSSSKNNRFKKKQAEY
jgi:drug/metabolite transporter (DMT)-like permease